MFWNIGALVLGLAYGIILQRARFCFVSAIRDWFLFRSFRIIIGIGAGLALSSVGFAILSLIWQAGGEEPTSRLWVLPLGVNTLVGGLLFGFGMVLAGGCASGTLFRLGEGYVAAFCALVAIVIAFPAGLWLRGHIAFLRPAMAMGEALSLIHI